MKKGLIVLICLLAAVGFAFAEGQSDDGKLLKGNLRIVIGSSSTGGDTYANSAIVAEKLAEVLDMNVKVDATGVNGAYDALKRDSSGHTIMIFHDQAYLGYLYEKKGMITPLKTTLWGRPLPSTPEMPTWPPRNHHTTPFRMLSMRQVQERKSAWQSSPVEFQKSDTVL